MGMYVNRVTDSLLANDPVTRSQINIYILRSTVVNAFATDRGSIFVTIGLLTRLHNEAELAFVLAHEIVHFKRRHVLKLMIVMFGCWWFGGSIIYVQLAPFVLEKGFDLVQSATAVTLAATLLRRPQRRLRRC